MWRWNKDWTNRKSKISRLSSEGEKMNKYELLGMESLEKKIKRKWLGWRSHDKKAKWKENRRSMGNQS